MLTIITSTFNNIEWANAFFLSMHKTLENKEVRIIVMDGSNTAYHKQLVYMEKYGLNVDIVYSESRADQILFEAMAITEDPYAVFIHIDNIMLKKRWDRYVLDLMKNGYNIVSSCPRHFNPPYPEGNFLAANMDLLIESKFGGEDVIKKMFGEWDENIYPRRADEHQTPGTATQYINVKNKGKSYLMPECYKYSKTPPPGGWKFGPITLDKGEEFMYHNFYASRHQRENNIPDAEFLACKNLIMHTAANAFIIFEYMNNVWPKPLSEYLKAYL